MAVLLLLEAASSLSSAEIEASSCSCCWLLLAIELPGVARASTVGAGGVVVVVGLVVEDVVGDLGVRLTVLPASSST